MKTRTIARSAAWRLLERHGASLHELRNKGELKLSRHVCLSAHKHGDGWIYLLRSEPKFKPTAPRLNPVFRDICSNLVTLPG